MIKITTIFTFIVMIIVNSFAGIGKINGISTGEISELYPNIFAPAGFTFSIWGLIYFLLGLYIIYYILNFKDSSIPFNKIGKYFSFSSITNTLWIFAWHYNFIGFSMVLMIIILFSLIKIYIIIRSLELTNKEKFFVKIPFSIYFGWITVATIANATTFLVSVKWNGFGIFEGHLAGTVVLLGLLIALLTILKNKDITYGLVIIWAYGGILFKHVSKDFFAGNYLFVINTLIFSIIILIFLEIYIFIANKNQKN